MVIFLAVSNCSRRSGGYEPQGGSSAAPTVFSESGEKFATLINMNGLLCARGRDVRPLGSKKYQVTCTRYRDASEVAEYFVDLDTGLVR